MSAPALDRHYAPPEPPPTPRRAVVAVVGNPNTGKSTLFNALTGLRQKVANYPGVTVEKHLGFLRSGETELELVDLPGMYSLAAHSPDELVALDVLLGRFEEVGRPDAVLVLVDASNLRRNLFLASQVVELGLPVVVALNMMDVASARGISVDAERLGAGLGAEIVPVVATAGRGIAELKAAMVRAVGSGVAPEERLLPHVKAAAEELARELAAENGPVNPVEVERALIDYGGAAQQRFTESLGEEARRRIEAVRAELAGEKPLAAREAESRYAWIHELLEEAASEEERTGPSLSDRADRLVSHPVAGTLIFVSIMALVFQAVFSWATPMMDLIDGGAAAAGDLIKTWLPEGAVASLLADGVVAGVGSVVVFLPQILLLFAFIIVLEDSGYMARAAFLMDRLMRGCGLSGQSFIPMLSSFACAVPGIMATRVIPDRRDRFATLLAAPFMTCSARLPVYALLISAFVPDRRFLGGLVNLQGLVLLGLYLLGIVGGVATALLLKRTVLKGPTPTFLMELPPYRWPAPRSVAIRLWDRGRAFLLRAGTVIFTVAVVVWALAYFPHPQSIGEAFDTQRAAAAAELSGEALETRLAELENREAAAYLEQSFLGRIGHGVEPLFRPLGWDWKVSTAVIAAFPAREVVIAVLGTIYAVGSTLDPGDAGLVERLQASTWPDGSPVFTVPMALGLMVFFAFCLQCGATVAAIRRETNSWRWPAFAWAYMTVLAYVAAFLTYHGAGALLGGGA